MGDLQSSADQIGNNHSDASSIDANRPIMKVIAENTLDLSSVLCSDQNASLFLKYGSDRSTNTNGGDSITASTEANDMNDNPNPNNTPPIIIAEEEAGPLATLVVSCVSSLPLQTPSYVALTLAVEERAPTNSNEGDAMESVETVEKSSTSYAGFANRCLTYASQRFARDLDGLCGARYLMDAKTNYTTYGNSNSDNNNQTAKEGEERWNRGNEHAEPVDAFLRCKLLLRYMALLTRVGIVQSYSNTVDHSSATKSMMGLIQLLTHCAQSSANKSMKYTLNQDNGAAHRIAHVNAAILLSSLVLSTIPYMLSYLDKDTCDDIMQSIQEILNGLYQSAFQPGRGMYAILLKDEQMEDAVGGKEDEEEEESEDEEEEDASGVVCADTLQDLLRTVQSLIHSHFYGNNDNKHSPSSHFAMLTDAPWNCLKSASPQQPQAQEVDEKVDDSMTNTNATENKTNFSYSGTPLLIPIPPTCLVIQHLSNGNNAIADTSDSALNGELNENAQGGISSSVVVLLCHSLDGIIFGRLSILDPPPDEDEDDDDDKEGEKEETSDNARLAAYVQHFNLVDRYFLSESIRDCLICHRCAVSDAGVEMGSSRDVAEQIWAVSHLFPPHSGESDHDSTMLDSNEEITSPVSSSSCLIGIEYGVVETVLSLLVQSPLSGDISSTPLSQVYLSRVLLELTKHQPLLVPQSLATATATLFQDCIPALVPGARQNLSHWLAFHLTNTDYQWPLAYWNHWTPYVMEGMAWKESSLDDQENDTDRKVCKRNSRGEFVRDALMIMTAYISDSEAFVSKCLPPGSPLLSRILLPSSNANDFSGDDGISNNSANQNTAKNMEEDLVTRIWTNADDPDDIREYMISDEVSEMVNIGMDNESDLSSSRPSSSFSTMRPGRIWWRTGVIIRVLLHPVKADRSRLEHALKSQSIVNESNPEGDDVSMQQDDSYDDSVDILTKIGDAVSTYKSVILASIGKDAEIHEENVNLRGQLNRQTDNGDDDKSSHEDNVIHSGEAYLLSQLADLVSHSSSLLESLVKMLLKNGIVSDMSILFWILDDVSHSLTVIAGDDGESNHVNLQEEEMNLVPGWWNFASMAMKNSVMMGMESNSENPNDGDISMIIETGAHDTAGETGSMAIEESPASRRMKKVAGRVLPLITYANDRIQVTIGGLDKTKNKVTPLEVDLSEGFKHFLRASISYIAYALKRDIIVTQTTQYNASEIEVENWIKTSKLGELMGQISDKGT